MNAEELFLANVGAIDRIAIFICGRNRVAGDADDFASYVKLSLIEHDYAVVRKFQGRSSFPTYLSTVMHHLFFQYRVKEWGKWRPSAEARRLGSTAIALEKMLTRDGDSFSEAVRRMTHHGGPPIAELEAIYLRLPPRQPRPVLVSDEGIAELAASAADDVIEMSERETLLRTAVRVLDDTIDTFAADDRLILQSHFWQARRVADIARDFKLDQKKTYKRINRLLNKLRRALERAGISRSIVQDLLTHRDQELSLGGNLPAGPSQETNGNFGSKRRLSQ